jgi:hypothetical protein
MPDPSLDMAPDWKRATVRRVTARLMPLFCLMYLIAYIDRQNVSYAKLDMVQALGLSEAAYGLGASLFFIGYFLFEAPSNLILARVGARVWFARIMFTWGLVTLALGFTQNATMFYVLRFLLGVTEAGFFPGVLYVLTLWYPQAHRARMVGPVHDRQRHRQRRRGGGRRPAAGPGRPRAWPAGSGCSWSPARRPCCWRPTSCGSLPTARPRPSGCPKSRKPGWPKCWTPSGAGWSTIIAGAWKAIFDPRVLLLAGLYIGMPLGAYGLSYWLPTIVKSFGVSNTVNGLINVIPWLLVAVALWFVPRHAAATGPAPGTSPGRAWWARSALVLSVIVPGAALKFAMLCIAAPAIFAASRCSGACRPASSAVRGPRPASRRSTPSATSAASSPRTWCRWCATRPAATWRRCWPWPPCCW